MVEIEIIGIPSDLIPGEYYTKVLHTSTTGGGKILITLEYMDPIDEGTPSNASPVVIKINE